MTCKDCFITVKVNKELPGFKAGKTVKVKVNNGVPIAKFWRQRLRDAKLDGCVEVVKEQAPAKLTKKDDDK